MQRRLAAIMVADVVGYSAMMEKAEERTAEWLLKCEAIVSERVTSLSGRIFNTAGDATLAEFGSAINALRCAGGNSERPCRSKQLGDGTNRDAVWAALSGCCGPVETLSLATA